MMYRALFRKLMFVQALSILSTTVAVIIDSSITSLFLGQTALSAAGIVMPLVQFFATIGGSVAVGFQTVVARKLGQGDSDGASALFNFILIFTLFLSTSSTGFVNETLKSMGIIKESIDFLHSKTLWRPIFYLINLWKETGWGTVIFFATLSSINTELYEAGDIDGATRLQKIRYITLPALSNTIIVVLILNLAKVLNIFEPVFVLYNTRVLEVSDVISTYIYRKTFLTAIPDYGYTTAVGLFKSLVGCILMIGSDIASKKIRGRGII